MFRSFRREGFLGITAYSTGAPGMFLMLFVDHLLDGVCPITAIETSTGKLHNMLCHSRSANRFL